MNRLQQHPNTPNTSNTTDDNTGKPATPPTDGLGHGRGGAGGDLHGSGDIFSFTIDAGQVTAASFVLPSGTKVNLPLTTGVSYGVSGADVLATYSGAKANVVVRYSDTDADGLYQVVARSKVLSAAPDTNESGFAHAKTVTITSNAGVVTGVTAIHGDHSKVLLSDTVTPPENIAWALNNGLLIETHAAPTEAGMSHYEIFRDGNGDGVYTAVASGTGSMVDLTGVLTQTDPFASAL